MGRVIATLGGVLVLALLAGGLTEATLAFGHRGRLTDDAKLRPAPATPAPTASMSSTPSPSPSVVPTPTPTPTPVVPTVTTSSFVHMRAGKSTSSAILADLNGGTVLQKLSDSDAQWQQVEYNGLIGYVFKSYLIY